MITLYGLGVFVLALVMIGAGLLLGWREELPPADESSEQ